MTDEELKDLIHEIDRDGPRDSFPEGAISEADFMRVMRKCGLC